MLLRSLTKHVREQNWFAVFLDFFIVVVGILIAFQITNWNTGRAERAEEYRALNALKGNISVTVADLSEQMNQYEIGHDSLKILAEYSDGQHDDLTLRELDQHILYGLYTLPYFEPTLVTYDELRNTGRLGLITNAELRNHLQALQKRIEDIESNTEGLTTMAYGISDPYLLENIDWRGLVSNSGLQDSNVMNWLEPTENRSDYKVILRQREFQNLVLYRGRLNGGYRRSAEELSTSLAELGLLIDASLAEFGRD